MFWQPEVGGLFNFLFPSFRLHSSFDFLLLCDGVITDFVLSVEDELSNWATNIFGGLKVRCNDDVRSGIARPPRRQGSASCSRTPCTLQAVDKTAVGSMWLSQSDLRESV